MVGWHRRLNGHEAEPAPGGSGGRGGLCAAVHGVTRVGHDWVTEHRHEMGPWPLSTSTLYFPGIPFVLLKVWKNLEGGLTIHI